MPRVCTVCTHPDRETINHALVAGTPSRAVADQFDVSKDAVLRHRPHIPATLAKSQEAAEVAHADDLLGQVRSLQARALSILDAAEATEYLRTALGAIREARGNAALFAELFSAGVLTKEEAQAFSRALYQANRDAIQAIPELTYERKQAVFLDVKVRLTDALQRMGLTP